MSIHIRMSYQICHWRLRVAVKLAKLGTRTQKNRPKPARDYLFKYALCFTLFCVCLFVCVFVCCLITRSRVWVSILGCLIKYAIGDSELLSNLSNLAQEHKKIGQLRIAVKLAKLGTRTQEDRHKPARVSLHFLSIDTFCYLKCPFSTRKYLLI